ncbi:hypothetical protein H6P81_006752 [Aristolochia fimbriata]|uniref:Uncharacterized protein n=1 Tax=Aristolochia fimbriata TaxID=158543 RepID=A0AAV7EYF8_ARIFI|nr:hypothetical protein H6P81_006752 [Aristolochia fimbriata]
MGSLRNEAKAAEGEEEEPVLVEQSQRFCMLPIRYKQLWEMYKKAEASFWTAEEVDLSQDVHHWEALSSSEKHLAHAFYGFQIAMENIHSEMYNLLLETYIKDTTEKHRLFNAIDNYLEVVCN